MISGGNQCLLFQIARKKAIRNSGQNYIFYLGPCIEIQFSLISCIRSCMNSSMTDFID